MVRRRPTGGTIPRMSASNPYTLRRSPRARTVRLTLGTDGELVVTLPPRAPERWAERLVEERAPWIARHRARLAEVQERLAARPPLGSGRLLAIGGVAHALVVEAGREGSRTRIEHRDDTGADRDAMATPDGPTLHVLIAPGDERPLADIVERWLRGQARLAFQRRIALRARDLSVTPRTLAVRDQRSRWGSASRKGTLSLNWRLILAPAAVLDYVVVHELAHLRVFGHGPRFWSLVRSQVPEADRYRRWLRAHDADLRHALD
jgi:predicted metal-dependent hydrolase